MYAFSYSNEWADLICSQMMARNDTSNISECGYLCICIGKKFDKVIRNNYEEINRITGRRLHIFSLTPPPQSFVSTIESEVRYSNLDVDSKEIIKRKLAEIRRREFYHPDDRTITREKVSLLTDLSRAGLAPDKYADFIFLDIKRVPEEHSIDVVVAKRTHLGAESDEERYLDLFEKMGNKAIEHFEKGSTVEEYVKDLSFEWDAKLSLKRTLDLTTYIKDFIENLLLK